ncbi:hypothetical protein AHiyo8_28610 [Arthrobacter sp. Hiyo8]|nr:hypothetical protein AHiyo8_28610 [Arthrobacter sp. Hiyo8]
MRTLESLFRIPSAAATKATAGATAKIQFPCSVPNSIAPSAAEAAANSQFIGLPCPAAAPERVWANAASARIAAPVNAPARTRPANTIAFERLMTATGMVARAPTTAAAETARRNPRARSGSRSIASEYHQCR